MTEENKEVIVEETPQQEIVAEQPQTDEIVKTQEEAPKKDSSFHWEQTHQALRLQKQQIEELKSKLEQSSKPEPQQEEDVFAGLDPKDYLTVEQARELSTKQAAKEAAKTARQVVQEYIQQQTVANDEARARAKYEDFDYVIEHFAIPMIKNDPALAYKIQSSKNPAEVAYKLAKISDEYEAESMKTQEPSQKAQKILKNTQRPVSSSAATTSLKSQADNFSKMTKEEIWAQSQKYARQA